MEKKISKTRILTFSSILIIYLLAFLPYPAYASAVLGLDTTPNAYFNMNHSSGSEYIRGSVWLMPVNGTGLSMHVNLGCSPGITVTVNVTLGIYYNGTNTLLIQTEERNLVIPNSAGLAWYTFNFSSSPPLYAGYYYKLVAWMEVTAGTGTPILGALLNGAQYHYYCLEEYDSSYPASLTGETKRTNPVSIYVLYDAGLPASPSPPPSPTPTPSGASPAPSRLPFPSIPSLPEAFGLEEAEFYMILGLILTVATMGLFAWLTKGRTLLIISLVGFCMTLLFTVIMWFPVWIIFIWILAFVGLFSGRIKEMLG